MFPVRINWGEQRGVACNDLGHWERERMSGHFVGRNDQKFLSAREPGLSGFISQLRPFPRKSPLADQIKLISTPN